MQILQSTTANAAKLFGGDTGAHIGKIENGFFADLVVFDPKTVNSPATYENPAVAPVGIRHVFRNGAEMDLN